ncbi:hypothetical protein SDC9_116524 [bioreactor metagenome]|uniref:Uncharacterized protein n=1 Tax=bioreactor metagenome TaxID=1076179 RepID=A0A645BVP9_9ZZZZ
MSKTEKAVKNKYSKQLLLSSKSFSGIEKDLLSVLLADKKEYTMDECKNILEKEKGRKVK